MRLPKFARTTLTVKTAGTRTVHGSEVEDWSPEAVTTRPIERAFVVPASVDEVNQFRTSVQEVFNIYIPPQHDLDPREKVTWPGANGRDYHVVGDPAPVPSPSGGYSHILFRAERWTG